MIDFHVLGPVDLRAADGRAIHSILAGPKRVALLAYLALEGEAGFVSRDTLLGTFWPESDQDRARNSLRNALHVLRRGLGPGVVVTRGDDGVALDPERIRCDVRLCHDALEAGRFDTALSLYRGELLAGIFLGDAPAFEQWLDLARRRLRDRVAQAAATLADALAQAGDLAAALARARHALDLAPYDEKTALRRVISLLDRTGDRSGAIAAYEAFAASVRHAFDTEPAPATQALIAAVRARAEAPAPRGVAVHGTPPMVADGAMADGPGPAMAAPRRRPAGRRFAGAALLVGAVALGAWWLHRAAAAHPLDPAVVAVVPFRTGGADASLGYLREGMIDLLAAKLSGGGVSRSADPRSTLAAWREAADAAAAEPPLDRVLDVARRLGAGNVVTGAVVGTPEHLRVEATLLRVRDGARLGNASAAGPADSLATLVDYVAAQLLSLVSGEAPQRMALLAGTPLASLRAYLDGQAAYRSGSFERAVSAYTRALEFDSTFAPAALGLASAAGWSASYRTERNRALALAWASRDRLGARDRAFLLGFAGPRYPAPSSGADHLRAAQRAVDLAPDRPEAWAQVLGDLLFHRGPAFHTAEPYDRARYAFEQAVRLDSTFGPALSHLVHLAARAGDTAAVRRFRDLYLAVDSIGEGAEYVRWHAAAALGDTAALERIRGGFGRMTAGALWWIAAVTLFDGILPEDGERAIAVVRERTGPPSYEFGKLYYLRTFLLNWGRPHEAARVVDRLGPLQPVPGLDDRLRILDALYWDGDSLAAARAADRIAAAADPAGRAIPADDLCALSQWRVHYGRLEGIRRAAATLRARASAESDPAQAFRTRVCATLLDAMRATAAGEPDARTRIAIADSTAASAILFDGGTAYVGLALARMWEAVGEPDLALAALRRRTFLDADGAEYLSSYLREEGRIALATGDRDGAIRAFRSYLAMRRRTEPEAAAATEHVRRVLGTLLATDS